MNNKKENILITAALPYINNVPHMGHIVGSHLPADIFYRYSKMKGHNVIFVGGSDEHGTPSVMAAKDLGIPVKQLVDKLHEVHKKVYKKMGISYTNYSRTSSSTHHEVVKDFFNTVNKQEGIIHEGKVNMYYCEHDKMFLPDRFVVGICPKCGYDSANADQCEACGGVITPGELIEPKCKTCTAVPTMKESNHLYINLEKLSKDLSTWIKEKKDVWRGYVYSEAKKWLDEGLKSRSITRDMEWGIKVPLKGFEDKVFYVWFDAPIGYITFVKELGENYYNDFWKNKDTKIYHFLGKDNIPFHTIFWPAMLLANKEHNMPHNIVGTHFLNYEGKKFSKSKGIGVFCFNILDSSINMDTLRAYLTTVIPETKDAGFKWEEYKNNTESEVIGKLGNFMNRTLSMIWKNFEGKLDVDFDSLTNFDELDDSLIEAIKNKPKKIGELYSKLELREAYKTIMEYAREGNTYLERKAPWKLVKTDIEEARKVLYLALNLAKSLAIVAFPIIPDGMQKVWTEQLNFLTKLGEQDVFDESVLINISKNHETKEPTPLYEKIDDERLEELKKELTKPHSMEDLVR